MKPPADFLVINRRTGRVRKFSTYDEVTAFLGSRRKGRWVLYRKVFTVRAKWVKAKDKAKAKN